MIFSQGPLECGFFLRPVHLAALPERQHFCVNSDDTGQTRGAPHLATPHTAPNHWYNKEDVVQDVVGQKKGVHTDHAPGDACSQQTLSWPPTFERTASPFYISNDCTPAFTIARSSQTSIAESVGNFINAYVFLPSMACMRFNLLSKDRKNIPRAPHWLACQCAILAAKSGVCGTFVGRCPSRSPSERYSNAFVMAHPHSRL